VKPQEPSSEGCPDCAKAMAKYNRIDAQMARRGNFGIVPLPQKCKAHSRRSPWASKPRPGEQQTQFLA
jgi:hypothetical protein